MQQTLQNLQNVKFGKTKTCGKEKGRQVSPKPAASVAPAWGDA
jgi:hypothetical protein